MPGITRKRSGKSWAYFDPKGNRITDPDERDFDGVWVFENPDGPTTERWFHAAGCRRWLTVRRDTATDTVLEVH